MELLGIEFTEDLLRFSWLRTGNRSEAFELVRLALEEVEERATQWRTQKHRFVWAVRFLRDRLKERVAPLPGEGEISEDLAKCLSVAEPKHVEVLVLYCVGSLKMAEIAHVLGLEQRELKPVLAQFRERVRLTERTESELREQVKRMRLTEEERDLLERGGDAPVRRRMGREKVLGLLAVLLGVLMMGGWVAWERWLASEEVQMGERMRRLFDASRSFGPAGVDAIEGHVSELPDWLFLHGIEGVEPPALFAQIPVSSGRMLEWNGAKVAQITVESPKGMLWVGPIEAFGMTPNPDRPATGRVHQADWSGAWAVCGPHVFLLVVRDAAGGVDAFFPAASPVAPASTPAAPLAPGTPPPPPRVPASAP